MSGPSPHLYQLLEEVDQLEHQELATTPTSEDGPLLTQASDRNFRDGASDSCDAATDSDDELLAQALVASRQQCAEHHEVATASCAAPSEAVGGRDPELSQRKASPG